MKFYIIDDDDLVHRLYEIYMNKVISVSQKESFYNGFDAIKHLKDSLDSDSGGPDIILLDINMPIMDGVEFLDQFEKLAPFLQKIPSIFIVSSCILDEEFLLRKKYVTGLYSKPISEDILKNMVFNQISI